MRDAALLLLGHGSTLNADSSTPTYQHAEEIRRRGEFAEVHVAFWKEEPNFRQALRQTSCRTVYVVPNFISSGYFTEQIIPRELGLTGSITYLDGQEIYYCQPVGLSSSMTGVLLQRAHEVVVASNEACIPGQTCLFICGHGTSLNDNSTKIIHEQAEIIRARGVYADCQPVLMEQRPFVKDWRDITECPDVIVVPFFISDGLHSYEDIPVLLGLTHNMREKGFTNPHREGARRLWYATAIGTEPAIADAILAQVGLFDMSHAGRISSKSRAHVDADRDNLERFAQSAETPWKIGQVLVEPAHEGGFHLRHQDDGAVPEAGLQVLFSLAELRDMIFRDPAGDFRPLRAAPNLPRGWILEADDLAELQAIFDYLYPAAIANWSLAPSRLLAVTPWSETAERQSGRFRIVREIDADEIREVVAHVCESGCLKRRLWSPAEQTLAPSGNEIPLLCPEACNYFVSKVREALKGPGDE